MGLGSAWAIWRSWRLPAGRLTPLVIRCRRCCYVLLLHRQGATRNPSRSWLSCLVCWGRLMCCVLQGGAWWGDMWNCIGPSLRPLNIGGPREHPGVPHSLEALPSIPLQSCSSALNSVSALYISPSIITLHKIYSISQSTAFPSILFGWTRFSSTTSDGVVMLSNIHHIRPVMIHTASSWHHHLTLGNYCSVCILKAAMYLTFVYSKRFMRSA